MVGVNDFEVHIYHIGHYIKIYRYIGDIYIYNGIFVFVIIRVDNNNNNNNNNNKLASLPVQMGGLGVRSACMLAPSAFSASAAAVLPLQEAILSASLAGVNDSAVNNTKTAWTCQSNRSEPPDAVKHIQRA